MDATRAAHIPGVGPEGSGFLSTVASIQKKLQEFATLTDNMEEVSENREQIEISRYYERLPKPAIIATEEFLSGEIFYKEGKDGEVHSTAQAK